MRGTKIALALCASILALLPPSRGWAEDQKGVLTPVGSIALPGVEGRIDHFAVDLAGKRLFVCALGANSVEVIGLDSGSVIHRIRDLSEPQGVSYVPEVNKIYVSNAGSGECDIYDGTSYQLLKRLDLGGDADNMHYDPAARRLYVSAGSEIKAIDTATDAVTASFSLPGHPEGFVLEREGARIFANVPLPSRSIFVIDRALGKVSSPWRIGTLFADAFSNFPMSLDEPGRRLFVGSRVPPSLKVIDTDSGKPVAHLGTDGDPDDIFFDSSRRRIYVSCGAGFIDVFQELDPDHYREISRVATAAGGRTSLWVPEIDRLFVAVPRGAGQDARVLEFSPR